jgi:hypothetical protein
MRLFVKLQIKHDSTPSALYTFSSVKDALRLLALSDARVDAANGPDGGEEGKHAQRDDNGLPVACRPGVVVRDNEIAVPEVVDEVDGGQFKAGATQRVHECPVEAGRVVDERDGGEELDVGRALGEDDAEVHAAVGDALAGSGALEEGHLEGVRLAGGQLAQVSGQSGVPADAEAVLPGTEDGVAGLQLEQRLLVARAELGRGNVANVVSEVRVDRARVQVHVQALQCERGGVHVRLLLPLDAREMVLEASALVDQPVSLLGSQVAAPVRHLDVALQECRVGDGLGELVAHAHGLLCASGHVVVEPIGERGALLLRVGLLLVVELSGERRVVGHIAVRELDLGSLLLGQIGGGRVRAEGVLQVLLVGLGDLRGDGLEGGEDRVGDADGLLLLGRQRFGEVDLVVLGRAARVSFT